MRGRKGLSGLSGCLGSLGLWSLLGWLVLAGSVVFVKPAAAFVVINEFLADPAAGLAGDANGDGVRSASNDEFVEILNYGFSPVDLTGWSLADASATRHVFPQDTTLSPYQYLVVFGGGAPQLDGIFWQLASTGTLSLNNTNETIFLRDASTYVIDQVYYGSEGNKDQSLTRFPEGTSPIFVGHKSLPQSAGAAFSPGTGVDGKPLVAIQVEPPVVIPVEPLVASSVEPLVVIPVEPPAAAAVPELPTLLYGLLGALGMMRIKRQG
ncbi:MAG: lamin tail domain-containing protein [Candidatus Omnitrophica bacterium]|nr:lamin tail domain-containing protein [Candidatus Omnitrophota bacterium]